MVAGFAHPNPNVRKEVIMCIVRFFQQTKVLPDRAVMKPIVEGGMKAMDDSDKDVREAASELLGTVMKLFGERSMLNYMEQLDKIKQEKVKAVFEKVTVNVKVKPTPAAAAPAKKAVPARAAPKESVTEEAAVAPPAKAVNKENDPPKMARAPSKSAVAASTSSSAAAKAKAPAASSSSSASAAAGKKAGAGAAGNDDVPPFSMSEEDSRSRAEEVIPAELREKLENANWKLRLEGCEELGNVVRGQDPESIEAEVIVRSLQRKPGWKDANVQVLGKTFEVIVILASTSPKFNRACAAAVIPGLVEKTSEAKLKTTCYDCFTLFAEKLGLQFVYSQRKPLILADSLEECSLQLFFLSCLSFFMLSVYQHLAQQKNPKVLTEVLKWMEITLPDFGVAAIKARDLVGFSKGMLENANPGVRKGAIEILVALRIQIGPSMPSLLYCSLSFLFPRADWCFL